MPSQTFILKKILEVPLKFTDKKDISLVLEISTSVVSALWCSNGPKKVWGLEMYEINSGAVLEQELSAVFSSIKQQKTKAEKVNVFIDLPEFMLVPDELYSSESAPVMLELFYGGVFDTTCKTESLKIQGIKNIYRFPSSVAKAVAASFPNAKLSHSNVKQINNREEGSYLSGIVSNNVVKFFLYHNHTLQLVKHFSFITHDDVVYSALQLCSAHGIEPGSIKFRLNGMVVKDSALYQSLYQYFLDLDLEENISGVQLTSGFSEIPKQYLSHLIDLAL